MLSSPPAHPLPSQSGEGLRSELLGQGLDSRALVIFLAFFLDFMIVATSVSLRPFIFQIGIIILSPEVR